MIDHNYNEPAYSQSSALGGGEENNQRPDARKDNGWRFYLTALFFAVIALLIVAQTVRIQVTPQAKEFLEIGENYEYQLHVYYPARGQIYDRWGTLLAGNKQVYEIALDMTLVDNPETIAFALSRALSNHLGYNSPDYYDQVFSLASRDVVTGSTYVVVADFVTEEEITQLKDWAKRYADYPVAKDSTIPQPSIRGLVYRPRVQRVYPDKDLASNILGFVGWTGKGVYGIEEEFNDLLGGEPQTMWMPVSPYIAQDMPDIENGADLVLTIDREIQRAVERILDEALVTTGSEGGTIVVADPETGEILAMASTPRIDLNQYYAYDAILCPECTIPFNGAVSKEYEPGSVFKVLTMAAALDAGAVEPDTEFVDTGSIEIGGIYIRNWNWGAWGPQNMTGCLQHSLNVCLAWVAKELGPSRFYAYMQNFGIGHLTGVDLAAETGGRLKLPGDTDWYESDLGTNSFGQGVTVTPVQMVMAVSALANDGQMMMPHLLRSMVDNNRQYTPARTMVGTPISAETAHTITDMLADSLEEESSDALITGYRVAGKTGTAEIATPAGYTSDVTHASFVGWGPVDDPKFLVYVWLEKPTSSPWGSVVAAPVFREVFKQVVMLTNLPPDDVREKLGSH